MAIAGRVPCTTAARALSGDEATSTSAAAAIDPMPARIRAVPTPVWPRTTATIPMPVTIASCCREPRRPRMRGRAIALWYRLADPDEARRHVPPWVEMDDDPIVRARFWDLEHDAAGPQRPDDAPPRWTAIREAVVAFPVGYGTVMGDLPTYMYADDPVYIAIYFALIIFFTYFYVSITFNPDERADEMKKFGGFIPGIRPGKPTADYLRYVLSRITLPGSIYLGLIAVLPNLFLQSGGSSAQNLPFGGTAVLIMIGVGLDTVKQIESQLMQRNYEGFLR